MCACVYVTLTWKLRIASGVPASKGLLANASSSTLNTASRVASKSCALPLLSVKNNCWNISSKAAFTSKRGMNVESMRLKTRLSDVDVCTTLYRVRVMGPMSVWIGMFPIMASATAGIGCSSLSLPRPSDSSETITGSAVISVEMDVKGEEISAKAKNEHEERSRKEEAKSKGG